MQNIFTAWLTTNYTCNCKCDWCYAQKMLAKHRCMDLQYAKQIVNYLQANGIQTITLIDGINISIKGTTEEEYLYNTHQTGLCDMIEGYHNLKHLGFEPSISYVITTKDTNKFDKFVEMLSKEKLDNLVIQFEKPSLSTECGSKTMDIRDMGNFSCYIFSVLERGGFNYTIETSFPLCLIKKDVLQDMIEKKRISTCCHVQKGNGIVYHVITF